MLQQTSFFTRSAGPAMMWLIKANLLERLQHVIRVSGLEVVHLFSLCTNFVHGVPKGSVSGSQTTLFMPPW